MVDGDEDLGLGLRLPWGRVSPPDDEAFAAPPSTAPPGDRAPVDEPPTDPGTPPFDPTALHRRLDALLEAIDGRFDRLDERLAHLEHGLPERLELVGARLAEAATVEALRQVDPGGSAEESDADAVGAVLDRRLDRLETLVASFHETTMGALGRNHERIVAVLDASHAALIDRLAPLAPAELVARLIQGVITTGEMLDAELIDLKRLLADRRPPGP